METKAQSWNDIAAHYQNLAAHNLGTDMLHLVQHIISSGASKRLFAFVSLATLKIGIYENLSSDLEMLWIDFDRERQLFCFRYFADSRLSKQPEFQRLYAREIGIKKFDQFLEWVCW